ncbi:hypothetical protein T02_623 [Trichinella nativa]|uniref:Uncharacterized protein n=1 Tax=Trichinella nativa TaxID=6335 RepID=A0A0V1L7C1_9BILA|nr:hypothetical protein T02_623 [Trichinella nativa]
MAIPTNQYVNMHIFLLSGFRQPVMFKARHFKLRSSCSLHVMFTNIPVKMEFIFFGNDQQSSIKFASSRHTIHAGNQKLKNLHVFVLCLSLAGSHFIDLSSYLNALNDSYAT